MKIGGQFLDLTTGNLWQESLVTKTEG